MTRVTDLLINLQFAILLRHTTQNKPKANPILTDDNRKALSSNGVGPLNKKAKKTVNKMSQFFEERCCSIAHLFYSNSLEYWYLFYFDNRDLSDVKNHWEKGQHIHLINDLWFKDMRADEVWEQYLSGGLGVSTKIHIRYSTKHKNPNLSVQ